MQQRQKQFSSSEAFVSSASPICLCVQTCSRQQAGGGRGKKTQRASRSCSYSCGRSLTPFYAPVLRYHHHHEDHHDDDRHHRAVSAGRRCKTRRRKVRFPGIQFQQSVPSLPSAAAASQSRQTLCSPVSGLEHGSPVTTCSRMECGPPVAARPRLEHWIRDSVQAAD